MTQPTDRLQDARWILERQLGWIAAADVKVGVVVAIQTALVSALAAAYTSSDVAQRTAWIYFWCAASGLCSTVSVVCAALAAFPNTKGPQDSLVFFVPIAQTGQADYVNRIFSAPDAEILRDLSRQIHRNAEIAAAKFRWVSKAMGWAFAGTLPWALGVVLLVRG